MTQDRAEYAELEHAVGVRQGFFLDLVNEDDWSFVIKLHALFEAACAHLLLFHFQEPDLAPVVARLELSNKNTGKVAFLAALQLVGKTSRRYIAALSELRNTLVHDVRNAEFNLTEWYGSQTPSKQKALAVSFSPLETFVREGPKLPGLETRQSLQEQAKLENVLKRAAGQTKWHIWIGAHHVLTDILDMKGYSEYRQWEKSRSIAGDDEE